MTGSISLGNKSIFSSSIISFNPLYQPNTTAASTEPYIYANYGRLFAVSNGVYKLAKFSVGDPIQESDATTKKYVDDSIQSAIIDSWNAAY